MRMSRRWIAVVAVTGGVGAAAAVAAASIPDATDTIHGCYQNVGGGLRVIDTNTPGATCDVAGETALAWNRTGSQGPAGSKGDPGPAGPKGDPGAGVVAYRTSPDQRGAFVDEPNTDANTDHLDTRLQLPAGTYTVFAHWFLNSPGAICFLVLHDGPAPIGGSIYGAIVSDPNIIQLESTFGVPETVRYSTTVEHGQAAVMGSISKGGYAVVRCEGERAITAQTSQWATITALRVASTVIADPSGRTDTPPEAPSKGIALKALPKGTTPLSKGTQSQLLKIASLGTKKPTRQQRARTVLLSTQGQSIAEIAATIGVSPQQVRKVVSDFARRGLPAIQ